MRVPVLIPTTLALAALLVACGQEPRRGGGLPPGQPSVPSGSAPLSDLKRDAGELVEGGPEEFDRWVKALRGYPIVVNQWASWCGPCRYEFPFFASQARKHGKRVAFLGVDAKDGRGPARSFLERNRVPFPHFFDPDAEIARRFRGGRAWPTTAFYDASGKLVFTRPGSYATEAKLAADVERFALGD